MKTTSPQTLAAHIQVNEIGITITARSTFEACAALPLGNWADPDRATYWCEARWRSAGHGYRRRIYACESLVLFEFADPGMAAAFDLLFGYPGIQV